MAKDNQLHINIDPPLKRRFNVWCARQGRTITEICLLVIRALLDGRLTVEDIKETDE